MRRAVPPTPEQQLYLTPIRIKLIRSSLLSWMDHNGGYSDAFNCSAVQVLGMLLTDGDVMADFLSGYRQGGTRANRELRARQVYFVVLHWLADIACGLGGAITPQPR